MGRRKIKEENKRLHKIQVLMNDKEKLMLTNYCDSKNKCLSSYIRKIIFNHINKRISDD